MNNFIIILFVTQSVCCSSIYANNSGDEPYLSVPQEVDIEKVKKRYWAHGQKDQLDIVQNRTHTSKKKIELAFAFADVNADPFLSTKTLSLSAGYHFSEFFSFHLSYATAIFEVSEALKYYRSRGGRKYIDEPRSILIGEGRLSFLYGKLNLFGSNKLHMNSYLSAGLGSFSTMSNQYGLLSLGVGERIHCLPWLAINFTFNTYWTNSKFLGAFQVGISFLIDPSAAK